MKFIADLHIHSHYSRATSKLLVPEQLDYWAGLKGIKVVGTGDFTHPGWLNELKEKLMPEGNGLFRLKKEYRIKPLHGENDTRFLLSAEISTIYKKYGQVRKVHHVIFTPGFKEAEKINGRLLNLGANLTSDGRPILGLDSQNLIELTMDCGESNFFIPAHIWTPWFSTLGSKSGFDSLRECFGDLTSGIFAVETGLSTDAPMNWLCSFLDKVTLISNSDAHSPEKLGRNANIFTTELSYDGITGALKSGNPEAFSGTIDLFPQEGKYHFDGHRKCGICLNPLETSRYRGKCPVCGKQVTIGVMNRIIQLADREKMEDRPNRLPYFSIIPLKELTGEFLQTGESSKQVDQVYFNTLLKLGPELEILLNSPIEEIRSKSGILLAEAVSRMRKREVLIQEGYDGEYGKIMVFRPGEVNQLSAGNTLFHDGAITKPPKRIGLINFDLRGFQNQLKVYETFDTENKNAAEQRPDYQTKKILHGNDPDQAEVLSYLTGPLFIQAGPGTGKTKTLTDKIAWIIEEKIAEPGQILAITFTRKAASEMLQRIRNILNNQELTDSVTVSTFHAFGLNILRENASFFDRTKKFSIADESIREEILKKLAGSSQKESGTWNRKISEIKNSIETYNDREEFFLQYENKLKELDAFDFDDLISKPYSLLKNHPSFLQSLQAKYKYIFIDEFQDINLVQYELIHLLMPETSCNLCVVGDPDQSIYGFRGASLSFVRRFFSDYPSARTFKLKTSYRCPQSILNASSAVLQKKDGFLTGLRQGLKINLSEQATGKSEAEFIARKIVDQVGGLSFFSIDSSVTDGNNPASTASLSETAVLCRTKNQFPALIKAFNDHNIPCQVVGDQPFYKEKPFSSLINLLQAIFLAGTKQLIPFLRLNNLNYFNTGLESFKSKAGAMPLPDFVKRAAADFFPPSSFNELEFKRFQYISEQYESLEDFLASLRTGTGADSMVPLQEAVFLMTMHASKGLEFDCVFIPGCEQGIIPYTLYKKETDLDEERRLFYVGMTRVKRILYLSHAKKRDIINRKIALPKSDFIKSIEDELNILNGNYLPEKKDKADEQLKLF